MRGKDQRVSFVGKCLATLLFVVGVVLIATSPLIASDQGDAQGIVDKARVTFNDFMRDSKYGWLHEHLKEAKGLLIFPQVIKGGFFIGGSGGTGILAVRNPKTGDWSEPAFYTIGAVSFGLQIGGEAAEVIMMAMSQKAIDSLFASSFKLGADTSITLGPVGAGAKGNITADFISFAKSKGLYAGLNLEGSVVDVRDSLNKEYYGKEVRPVEIVVERKVSNRGSEELRATLKKAVK
ncbi:MAG TPA: lipid-binding SYLF domain-containing protein [Thermodesulfovibrionales bacterium]|nr:lipid-binding SYLF domain-containing protein [Thermodesulfovibrionales bacterium]